MKKQLEISVFQTRASRLREGDRGRTMLQRNRDAYRRQRRNLFLHDTGDPHFRLWWYESGDGAQRSSVDYHRQMANLHFTGNIDVVSGIGSGKILAILRESGKSGDGQQQHYHADLHIDASRLRPLADMVRELSRRSHDGCPASAVLLSVTPAQKARTHAIGSPKDTSRFFARRALPELMSMPLSGCDDRND
jgi:hypothetical protein